MAVDVGGYGSTQGLRPAKPVVSPIRYTTPRPSAVQTRRVITPTKRSYGGSSRPSSSGGTKKPAPKKPTPTKPPVKKPPAKPVVKPEPPSIDSYLGTDAAYQQALSGGKRSLEDYLSELGRRRGEAGTQYEQTKGSMERDRQQSLDDLREEFASRGLIQSGLYGREQGNFQKKFSEQMNALEQQQAGLIGDLLSQETNYRRESDLATQQAKQEALLRRAQKFNIGA